MIITFCGHSDYSGNEEDERKILDLLERKIGNEAAEIFLGGYGGFDEFAYRCCKKYKKDHSSVSLVFVTPYIKGLTLEKNKKKYDLIIYPELEKIPPRFAISHRNRYMVERADIVVAMIEHCYGGAYNTYKYAERKGKEIFLLRN